MKVNIVTSMLGGCGTKEHITNNNADNTETFATTEVVEQNTYNVTTEIESNENTEAETEISKLDTAGSDFSAFAFDKMAMQTTML